MRIEAECLWTLRPYKTDEASKTIREPGSDAGLFYWRA
jgi:hypothetical protein